jgi:ABC-type glycerol-3-phosphate transport system substrate-binding protein
MRKLAIVLSAIVLVLAFSGCSNATYLTPYTPVTSYSAGSATSAVNTYTPAATIQIVTTTPSTTPTITTSVTGDEQKYLQSAIPINLTQTQGNWQVTVVSVGLFSKSVLLSTNTYLRVDLKNS